MGKSNKTIECSAIGTQEDINHWPHLMGIDLPRIEAEIGLLIGSDLPRAMKPKEVRESKNRGPFAMRTVLGWMLSGPLGRKETKYPCQTSLPLRLTPASSLKISVT